jgi:hypothetical protein
MIPAIETAPVMSLRPQDVESLVDALHAYHAIYSPLFQCREQRQWSADYLYGLLLDIQRKSIEPMVLALHGADSNAIRAMQQFVSEGAWSDRTILQRQGGEHCHGSERQARGRNTDRSHNSSLHQLLRMQGALGPLPPPEQPGGLPEIPTATAPSR